MKGRGINPEKVSWERWGGGLKTCWLIYKEGGGEQEKWIPPKALQDMTNREGMKGWVYVSHPLPHQIPTVPPSWSGDTWGHMLCLSLWPQLHHRTVTFHTLLLKQYHKGEGLTSHWSSRRQTWSIPHEEMNQRSSKCAELSVEPDRQAAGCTQTRATGAFKDCSLLFCIHIVLTSWLSRAVASFWTSGVNSWVPLMTLLSAARDWWMLCDKTCSWVFGLHQRLKHWYLGHALTSWEQRNDSLW